MLLVQAGLRRDPLKWRLSGLLLALMVFAGLVGSAVIPPLVAARGQRRGLILTAQLSGALVMAALMWRHGLPWLVLDNAGGLVLLLQGLIGGPYLPLLALAAALLAGVLLALSLREPTPEPPRTDPQPAPI